MKRLNTIEDIEQSFWGEAHHDDTNLVKVCHNLRSKNLDDFTVEDCRIMIGQDIALDILIPKSLIFLRKNIFAEDDLYEGDLLSSVLTSDKDFWIGHAAMKQEVIRLFESNMGALEKLDTIEEIRDHLKSSFQTFKID